MPDKGGGIPTKIELKGGFTPGRIYELTYFARDPTIVGLGMAGIRDLLSYFEVNPLAGAPVPERTLIFGIFRIRAPHPDNAPAGAARR